jgi:hypothetical protein
MLAQFAAKIAVVRTAAARLLRRRYAVPAAFGAVALTLGGCLPTTVPLAGADPADPGVPVAGVGYRANVAPYSSRRPAAPAAWRDQNDRAAPAPKPDR